LFSLALSGPKNDLSGAYGRQRESLQISGKWLAFIIIAPIVHPAGPAARPEQAKARSNVRNGSICDIGAGPDTGPWPIGWKADTPEFSQGW
jgi:hypothetical protein